MNKLISVIVPSYNREKFIYRCINSVYKQTYRPIELIVIDDGSTDKSAEIIEKFKKEKSCDDFIIKFIQQENSGAQVARNKGIKNSTGEYIQFLDSDDELDEKKLEIQIKYFDENPQYDINYTNGKLINENNIITDYNLSKPLSNTEMDYVYAPWQCMTALYKKEAVIKIGLWNEDLSINQDWEYSLRAIINESKVGYINDKLCYYRKHSGENIGTNLTAKKILGKELSTHSIYNLLKKKKKLNDKLLPFFYKRFMYCIIQYGTKKEFEMKKNLIEKISNDFNSKFLNICKTINVSFFYKIIMFLYERKKLK